MPTFTNPKKKIGRNQPCPCGSGKKYKKCCGGPVSATARSSPLARLDGKMQQGYRFSMQGQCARACQVWTEVWDATRARLTPQMRTCDSAQSVFSGQHLLFNWAQDFVMELLNAGRDELRYAEQGVQLCEQLLAQFPDESDDFRVSLRAELADLLCCAGQVDRGQKILVELCHDHPDSAIGYVRLADVLAHGVHSGDPPIDITRARTLLEQALGKPDAVDFDVARRLEAMR